jgi:hypothetical protein
MTTVAVVLGFVALVSIAINIFQRVQFEKEKNESADIIKMASETMAALRRETKDLKQMSEKWKEECRLADVEKKDAVFMYEQADKKLKEANDKLAKYDRKRDSETGKVVSKNPTKPLTGGETVLAPTEKFAAKVFALAKKQGFGVYREELSDTFPSLWFSFKGTVSACLKELGHDETELTASEFLKRLRVTKPKKA